MNLGHRIVWCCVVWWTDDLADQLSGGFVDLESGEAFGPPDDESSSDDANDDDDGDDNDGDDAESDKGMKKVIKVCAECCKVCLQCSNSVG